MFDRIKQKLSTPKTKQVKSRGEKGQGLVELAIMAPLLIFLLIGVFEVGHALRSYLALVNANREVTRYAVRPAYLDFSDTDPATIGYDNVMMHVFTTLGRDPNDPANMPGQLPVDFNANSTLIISHLVADTGQPCRDINNCDCSWFDDPDYEDPSKSYHDDLLLLDDLAYHPGMPGYSQHTMTYGPPITTNLNYDQELSELKRQNNKFNCQLLKKGGGAAPSANNVIITELFYDQPQLFGFPFISNPLTDPVSLYTHTTMRLIAGARSTGADTIGPVCDAYPFIIDDSAGPYGVGDPVDILGGPGGGDWGWLGWNPDNQYNSAVYLNDELRYSRSALNDFTNVDDPNDHTLSVGDWVASIPGSMSQVQSAQGLLTALIGKTIRVPVWSGAPADFQTNMGSPPDQRDAYFISRFAWVRIDSVPPISQIASTKDLWATYLGDATNDCSGPPPIP